MFLLFSLKPDQDWIDWLVALLSVQQTFLRIQRNNRVRQALITGISKSSIWSSNRILVCLAHVGSSYRLTNMIPSAPDMSQLKLGVRSVAGKLSVMASGVVNTIQVRSRTALHPNHFVERKEISNNAFPF